MSLKKYDTAASLHFWDSESEFRKEGSLLSSSLIFIEKTVGKSLSIEDFRWTDPNQCYFQIYPDNSQQLLQKWLKNSQCQIFLFFIWVMSLSPSLILVSK